MFTFAHCSPAECSGLFALSLSLVFSGDREENSYTLMRSNHIAISSSKVFGIHTMDERLRVLVLGSGGREHAFAWKIAQSPLVDYVHVAPGNGGTETADGHIVNISIPVDDFFGLVKHSKEHGINLCVVGPEQPLVDGVQDYLRAAGIRCFGPSQAAARLEGSKAFAKAFMAKNNIPTADYRTFCDFKEASRYLESVKHDVVIKASGLAAGKGVIIPQTKEEAFQALREMMVESQFGDAAKEVVIEERLEGQEISILSFCDGYTVKSLPPAQDHKRIFDDDTGPNTGGMGAYAPTPTAVVSDTLLAEINHTIVQRTIDCLRRGEKVIFVGILFTGLMLTQSGPKVLEYNVRGGDPEIQTLLPLLSKETDLAKICLASTEHWLDGVELQIEKRYSATVVASAEGYPGAYAKHNSITLQKPAEDIFIFHAGTSRHNNMLITTGGRVIAATATATTLEDAVARAYRGIATINFEGMHFRKDIAHRAFQGQKVHGNKESDALLTYAFAGVSIDAGNDLVSRIKAAVKTTSRPGADAVIGGFGGAFDLAKANYGAKAPIILGAIDGVGTKLKIAYAMDKHSTVGIDLVAMNVNDLIVQGAEPLFFLDCYTCSKLDVEVASSFVEGVAEGCRIAGCALIGGETAEMPGILCGSEYDAVGAAVGAIGAGKQMLPDKESMLDGDVLIGLGSSGVHSNGFSLVRKIIERKHLALTDRAPWSPENTIGDSLLTPTRIYAALLRVADRIKGAAHITGGGLVENIPRMLPHDLKAELDASTWERPRVFEWLQGSVDTMELIRVFNCGLGMVIVVSEMACGEVMRKLEAEGERVYRVGRLAPRKKLEDDACVVGNLEAWSR